MSIKSLFQNQKFISLLIFLSFVFLLVMARLLPHPNNFTPLIAVSLFAGSFWKKSQLRFALPVVALFLSDVWLGFYPGVLSNYSAMALTVLLAPSLSASLWTLGARSVLASGLFFTVSNFGVWLAGELYPRTWPGLVQCYTMAVPFFSATLASTLIYSAVLYIGYRWALAERGFEGFLKAKYG